MEDGLYVIDWTKVKPEVIKMLETGEARIVNGVARSVADNSKILQHMPFKKIYPESIENLTKAVQAIQEMQTIAMAVNIISSVSIMGAIIVSTAYLSRKIDMIGEKIDVLRRELQGQNLVYYTDKISVYFGSIEALRELMKKRHILEENNDLAVMKISELLTLRNQLFSFIDGLIQLCDNLPPEHKRMAIEFLNMMFDLIPKGVFVESQAAYKLDRIYLGDNIREAAKSKYINSLDNYRAWGNKQYHSIVRGKGEIDENRLFTDRLEDIKRIVSSEENKLLLEHSI